MQVIHTRDPQRLGLINRSIRRTCKLLFNKLDCDDRSTNMPALPSKRVFILGPAHHIYLTGCALSKFKTYDTPLGELSLDLDSTSLMLLRDINSFALFLHGCSLAKFGLI